MMGQRKRYRLLDLERLGWRLGTEDLEAVRRNLEASLAEALAREQVRREPCWTESLAVGSAGFVEAVKPLILSRQETEIVAAAEGVLVLREAVVPYGQEREPKSEPKAGL
jgi:putative transposase